MKLYDDPRAPNPRRVRMFLAEKGIEVERVVVDIGARANLEASYLEKNPLGLVPCLELDDGRRLCESMAICRYLEALQPEPPLFGRDPFEQGLVEQWSRHAELELLFPIALGFQHGNPYWEGRRRQVPEFAEVSRENALARLAFFDARLRGREFLVGDAVSVADITLYCALDFGRVLKIRLDEAHPDLLRFHRAMGARPSAKA